MKSVKPFKTFLVKEAWKLATLASGWKIVARKMEELKHDYRQGQEQMQTGAVKNLTWSKRPVIYFTHTTNFWRNKFT